MNVLQIRHVLCPMDLSPDLDERVGMGERVARARSAELRMLHVVAPEGIVPPESLGFGERDDMITKLRGALTSIDPDNRLAGAAITQGDPGGQILQFARSKSAGLIVMGAAGAERPERPIGSVTAIVVARSDCPVLIVPAGRRVKSQRAGPVRTDRMRSRFGSVIRQRHEAGARACLGDTCAFDVRVRDDRATAVRF